MEGESKDASHPVEGEPQNVGTYPGQPSQAGVYPGQLVVGNQPPPYYAAQAGGFQYPAGAYPPQPGMAYAQPQPTVIVSQPTQFIPIVGGPRPNDFLVLSFVSCLCCFWPTGLVAIYFSMRTNTLMGQGDIAGAQAASNTAKILNIASVVIGLLLIVIIIILAATGTFVPKTSSYYYGITSILYPGYGTVEIGVSSPAKKKLTQLNKQIFNSFILIYCIIVFISAIIRGQ